MESDPVASLCSLFLFAVSCFMNMDCSDFLSVLEKSFKEAATSMEGEEEPSLQSPGVEGVQMMLEAAILERHGGVLSGFTVTIDFVRSFFEKQGWEEKRSLSWTDLVSLSQTLGVLEQTKNEDEIGEFEANTELAHQLSELSNKMHQRQLAHEFPFVLPSELQTVDAKEAAEQTLGLIEKTEHVKIESWIEKQTDDYFRDKQPDDYFQNAQVEGDGNIKTQVTELKRWNLR